MYTVMVIILGYLMFTYIIVVISSGKANVNRNLMLYQERMRHLVAFMKLERIPGVTQDKAIKHFEHMWLKTHGIEAHDIFHKFHHALRQDVMLQLYENTLSVVPAFSGVEKGFTRQLATNLQILYFLKGNKIVKKNNIVSHIYIVHRGVVDVIGPDGTRFCKLQKGSMFGNIDNSPANRYMMTIVAAKHVDTLVIPTTTFYELARGYPSVRKELKTCVLRNVGYVPRFADEEVRTTRKKFYKRALFPVNYQKISVLKVPIAYLTSLLTCYQFSFTSEFIPWIFFAGLALDGVIFGVLFMSYNMEYYDDSGDIVDDITLIRSRELQELQFYLDALSILPIELFCLFTTNNRMFWHNLLHLNRLLRARHLYLFFTKKYEKLNVNMLATKLTSMISSFTLLLHVLACSWYLIGCHMECSPESWMIKANCQHSYICSIYFIVSLITTTGFGDIRPATINEIIFCSITSVAMVAIVAMFMGDVSNVVQNYSYTLSKYDTAMSIMRDYLKDGQISYPLIEKALGYAKNLWLRERGSSQPALLAEAPTSINEEIMVAAYGRHLFEAGPFFEQKFN
ncbi:potassium voltage-gated channel protein eag-like [Athalia rosae]|uniref:potassium voltage-gated channel protein eag-like n=1 Tax=Athalia rosae TaxID=37344 RepID=UPI002033BB80|nr:potassium voltage-gated channel protein eag-like [Athalia rosae]